MSKAEPATAGTVGHLPRKSRSTIVSDELSKVMALVVEACPAETRISFTFDGKLHMAVDVRTLEDVLKIEMILPGLGAGIFHDIQRAQAPRHGFGHRLTALVDR